MVNEIIIPFNPIINLSFVDNTVYSFQLPPGSFLLEVWGASGGDTLGGVNRQIQSFGGRGGYSRGILDLGESITLYAYVGGSGSSHTDDNPTTSFGGFNGGGSSLERSSFGGGSGGGGSTDICTFKSEIISDNNHFIRSYESYQSRIIVAGGGGGSFATYQSVSSRIVSYGGFGGGTNSQGSGYSQSYGCSNSLCDWLNQGGFNSNSFNYVTGSNQISTGTVQCDSPSNDGINGAQSGYFGYGGVAIKSVSNSGGGGGGGWFGGYSGTSGGTGGAGGSGYAHTNTNLHSSLGSSFIVRDPNIIDGNSSIPCVSHSCSTEQGHHGDGYARITHISLHHSIPKDKCSHSSQLNILFLYTLFLSLILIK